MKFVIALAIFFLSVSASAVLPEGVSATGNHRETSSSATCEGDITIPVNTIVRGDKNSEHELGQVNADSGKYTLTVEAINQSSEHPDTDIIVRSGGSELTVKDVERKAFGKETANGMLNVENGKVTAYVKLGKDKVFSGGVCVILTMVPPEEPPKTPPEEPEEPEEPAPEPKVLPATGPGAIVATVATISTAGGYLGHYLATRRKL